MNAHHSELLPGNFAGNSRVWIYQSPHLFSLSEALAIEEMLEAFETATGVSGCSTDGSVRLIKEIEQRFGVNLFDRLMLAFRIKDKVQTVPLSQLPYALENGFIDEETLYFNNTVQTKEELETRWLIPLKDSWLAGRFLVK